MIDAEDVRRIALSLPETEEKIAWDMPTFRVRGGRMFLTLARDDASMAVRCPVEDHAELMASEPEKFSREDVTLAWLRVRLAALDDLDELRAIIVDAWRQGAPSALLDAVPAAGPERPAH
ncbi:MmcQ/YjbR family DNA-binding protein [Allostreptomyces psammosilenae]|uniref:MmcQ/YjbR family DNA-binding protein n=1 Tax=Allostreptomyces psammosilenae TaxID=1892865 RepID=A0A852ZQ77_9ACTN|nr:MmcQ/YjbR family DNA-binding protein [Allostreptomyces psammosilenae]NYI04553.1 hypothetical protein [Allostreptomyces psammosilenae]